MDETLTLEPHEARALGVLIEKELTTPEQYPLTLNALTSGCNQKSNRDPLLELSNFTVELLVDKLIVRGLVGRVHASGSRVEHFRHNARERLDCQEPQLAILAELLVRGPQTASQLKQRGKRMSPFETQEIFDSHLQQLVRRGLVQRVAPGPGSRAERFIQTLSPDAHPLEEGQAAAVPAGTDAPRTAAGALEARVAKLEQQLARLAEELGVSLEAEGSGAGE
jgi:uncharacterized protein YceH (UPF0502 family)